MADKEGEDAHSNSEFTLNFTGQSSPTVAMPCYKTPGRVKNGESWSTD